MSEFVTEHRAELVARCTAKVAARMASPSTEALSGIPLFLDQLAAILLAKQCGGSALTTAGSKHGAALLHKGFTIGQVVHDYGDVCQSITEMAVERALAIAAEDFQLLNLCLDEAIAGAVTEYGRLREIDVAAEIQARATEGIGILSYEARNLVWSATLAFDALKTGSVSVSGSTSSVVTRSLTSLRSLVEYSFTAMKLKARGGMRARISVVELMEVIMASVMAPVIGPELSVEIHDSDAMIDVDLNLLAPIIVRLVQSASDHTNARGHVILRSSATETTVRIEIEDECGGLQPGTAALLLEPNTVHGSLSLGLRGIESIGGTLAVHDLPGKGCVFTIEVPRVRL